VDFLETQFPDSDRIAIRRAVLAGEVQVNGETARIRLRLRAGDHVSLATPLATRRASQALPESSGVLYESASLIIVDKPAGITTVPDRFGRSDSLYSHLPALRPGDDLRVVHRLDRDTSGCLALAKGLAAARHLDVEFRSGRVHKHYLALVHGVVHAGQDVSLPLGPDRARPGKVVTATGMKKGFRAAHSRIEVAEAFGAFTLVLVRPTTGRGHQIRVHLQAIGHPIVGDQDYGGAPLLLSDVKHRYKHRIGAAEKAICARMFLHSSRLQLRDLDGREVEVTAPLPGVLQATLAKLRRFDAPRRPRCD